MNAPYADIARKAVESLTTKLVAAHSSYTPADFSSLEARVMAHLLTECYGAKPEAGVDVHTATAADAFGVSASEVTAKQREWAKSRNFMRMYGWQSPRMPL